MNKLLSILGFKAKENKFMDVIIGVANFDINHMEKQNNGRFLINKKILIILDKFDDGDWCEMDISLDYRVGKGARLVLRKYLEHSIIINHEVLGVFHTIDFDVPTESFMMNSYRVQLDALAERLHTTLVASP